MLTPKAVVWDERFTPDAEDDEGQATRESGEHLPLMVCSARRSRAPSRSRSP
jgi:hypothetical protein